MSQYGELKTSEKQDSSSETSEKNKKYCSINRKQCCGIILCIFLFLLYNLYVFFPTFYAMPNSEEELDFNFTKDIIDSPLSSNDLTASVIHHHSGFRKTCDDLDYGCCKIYSQCQIKNGYLDYKEHILDLHRITERDRIGSNCYSLDHLVHKWNVEYKSENTSETCENSKYGCCPLINTACDFSLRSKRGNNQETIDFYKQHRLHSHRVTVPKKNKEGSNCPSFATFPISAIVYAYNNGYPDPDDNGDLKFIAAVLFVVGCLLFCDNIKK